MKNYYYLTKSVEVKKNSDNFLAGKIYLFMKQKISYKFTCSQCVDFSVWILFPEIKGKCIYSNFPFSIF